MEAQSVAQAQRFNLISVGRTPTATRLSIEWTPDEHDAVRTLYPDYSALMHRLPHRTLHAIKKRADKLGVQKRRHVWTQLEVARLKRAWSKRRCTDQELRDLFPGMGLGQILAKARFVGMRRERTAPKALGFPVVDAIRFRAHDEGMTMIALDQLAETGKYFQKTPSKIVWKHIAAAAEALGGRLVPSWDEDACPARDELVFGDPRHRMAA